MSNILLSSANEFLKKKQSSLSESLSSKFNIPRTSQYSTEPKEKSSELSFFGKPFKLSEYKTLDEATKPILEKVSDIPFVRDVLTNITQRTSGTGISAMIKAASPDITFKQAYEVAKESQAKNDDTIQEKFLTQLVDATPQTLIGVALGFVPIAGIPLSVAYWSAISAGSQIEEKGEITSLTNIGIDVLGDRMLGEALSGLLKQPANTLFRTIKKTFATEGGTEVAQDILKYANDYGSAKTDKEKNKILNEVKEYFTSGQILITAGVGGIVGGGIGAGGYMVQQTPKIKNQQIEQLQKEGYTYDEAKEIVEQGGFIKLPKEDDIEQSIKKAKEARKYKSAEEFKKALGKTQGVLWSGRKGGITDLSKPLFTSENPNLALTYSLNYPENLELAEKDLQAFIPKDGKTLDLTTNKKAIQYLKKIGIDVKEGYSVRQTVYNNWNKIINEAKKDGYDYINHIGEDEFAQFLDIETVVLNPQKSLQSLTDFYNQAVKGTKKTKITEEVKPVPKELEPLAKEAKKYKTPEEFIDTLKKQGKIFYHGTPYKFDKFDISRVGERGRTEGRGFYFTDRPEVAKTYTNKPGEKIIPKEGVVIEAYLDIKKPMSVSQRKITDNQLTKIVSELSKTNDSLIPSYGDSVKDVVDALKTNDTDVDIISDIECGIYCLKNKLK